MAAVSNVGNAWRALSRVRIAAYNRMLPDTFRTARLLLRPIAPEDAGAIFDSYACDPEVTRFLTWRPHGSIVETAAYIAHCLAIRPDIARTYMIVDGDRNGLRGCLHLRLPNAHRLEFGYLLAHAFWGHGLMTEALAAVVAWALRQPSVFRVDAVCDVENIGSARVMEKAGLAFEGVRRRWIVHPNMGEEPRDCLSYARVR